MWVLQVVEWFLVLANGTRRWLTGVRLLQLHLEGRRMSSLCSKVFLELLPIFFVQQARRPNKPPGPHFFSPTSNKGTLHSSVTYPGFFPLLHEQKTAHFSPPKYRPFYVSVRCDFS